MAKVLIVVLCILGGLMVIGLLTGDYERSEQRPPTASSLSSDSGDSEPEAESVTDRDLIRWARHAVRETALVAPSTAEFPHARDDSYQVGGLELDDPPLDPEHYYMVRGIVDAENRMGATLRESWTVAMHAPGDGEYSVFFIELGGEAIFDQREAHGIEGD